MRMRTFMLLIMVFAMNILSAQERTITGIVVDGSMGDDPLPGATISVVRGPNKKVSHGTVTDYEGKFTLKVDAQDKSFSVRSWDLKPRMSTSNQEKTTIRWFWNLTPSRLARWW